MRSLLLSIFFLFPNSLYAEDSYDFRPSTPAGQEIPVNKNDLQIIVRASQILTKESNWNRNDNRECPEKAKTYSLFCALYKASVEVNGKFDHRLGALEEVRRTVEEFSKGKDYEHRLMGYNNDPSTTLKNVQEVLKTTESRVRKRLHSKQK